jgi:hypothetical protein
VAKKQNNVPKWRRQMDKYLESQGLLGYQTKGLSQQQIDAAYANAGVGAGKPKPQDTSPATATPTAPLPTGAPAWWQYQQQYGSPTTPVNRSFGNISTGAGGIAAQQYPASWYEAQAQLAAQSYNRTAQNPELKYNNPAWANVNKPASSPTFQGAPQWWQYAKQYGPIKQAPEAPLDDFYFRHPNTPSAPTTPPTFGGGGYGYGGSYYKRRGGGGGRKTYPTYNRGAYEPSNNGPAWATGGLANWSIG